MIRKKPRAIYTSSRRRRHRGSGRDLMLLVLLCLIAGVSLIIAGTWLLDGA
jgi:hypothetical protein